MIQLLIQPSNANKFIKGHFFHNSLTSQASSFCPFSCIQHPFFILAAASPRLTLLFENSTVYENNFRWKWDKCMEYVMIIANRTSADTMYVRLHSLPRIDIFKQSMSNQKRQLHNILRKKRVLLRHYAFRSCLFIGFDFKFFFCFDFSICFFFIIILPFVCFLIWWQKLVMIKINYRQQQAIARCKNIVTCGLGNTKVNCFVD